MKRFCVFLLLLSLFSTVTSIGLGQSRPRRVGNTQTVPQTTSPAPEPTQPGSPPVLRGANYPDNRKPDAQPVPSATPPEEVDAGDIIRVETTLITMPVSVMDRDGRYIPNLNKEDFRIWEDGVEQDVAFFASVDKPFSVVLMLDTSPSTQFQLGEIQNAAISFINQLRVDDKVMVVEFNEDVKILAEFTTDRAKLERAIFRANTDSGTSLYDAVDMVINKHLNRTSGRKAIVLFTDGVDTTSDKASYESNVMDAQELDALIYPVQYNTAGAMGQVVQIPTAPIDVLGQILGGVFGGRRRNRGGGGGGGGQPRGTSRGDYAVGDRYLEELANNTGGRQYNADTLQNMSYAFANVAEELRRQYTIGYYPKRTPEAGQRRMIKVRAKQPNLAVRSRDSYIFNPGSVTPEKSAQSNPPAMRKTK
jgi:Ca-activated chloride channel family protein